MIHFKHSSPSKDQGFTLPAVLLVSLTILVIGLSMTQTSSSIRTSIDSQYYDRLATEAAQSGVAYANYCFTNNSYSQSWGPALGLPNLTQSTSCTGASLSPGITSLVDGGNLRVTFSIGDTVGRPDGATLITSVGTVERLRAGTTATFETYTKTIKRVARSLDFQQGKAVFGYHITDAEGAFFATLQSDGKFRAAGSGVYGKLGTGNTNNILVPATYTLPAGKIASRAYTNFLSQGYQMFVKTTDGDMYGAGRNNYGQLGNGSTAASVSTPVKMNIPTGQKAVYAGPGGYATFVLTDTNNIYATGWCTNGLLGTGTCSSGNLTTPTRVALPTPNVNNLNTIPAQEIITDAASAYVRMQGGRVYGWGGNYWGQLADGTTTDSSSPKQIGTFGNTGKPKATQLAFDGDTIYILDSNGDAWAAGRNDYGEIGLTPTARYTSMQKVPIPTSAGAVTKITTDQWFASFLTASGEIWGAGLNDRGQLGNGTYSNTTNAPVRFILPSGVKGTYIYTASVGGGDISNTFAIGNDGKVYGAGSNAYGQIGNGATGTRVTTPAAMAGIDGTTAKAADVLTGYGSTVVLTDTGKIYTVGRNNFGQLGDGSTTNRTTPITPQYLQARAPNYIF